MQRNILGESSSKQSVEQVCTLTNHVPEIFKHMLVSALWIYHIHCMCLYTTCIHVLLCLKGLAVPVVRMIKAAVPTF